MFRRHSSQMLMTVALCSSFVGAAALGRFAYAATSDVVDLEADTHNNPPASTTDKSTPPPATTEPEKVTELNTKEISDAAKDEAAEEKLKLRAGERVGDDARGMAQVLGMSLQEGPRERVKVVEVAMNSPAFDAGVMKGDEIVAFQGFRGESYRKWIDGIRRLTTDTGAGLKIPVVVAREGEQLTVRIVVPEKPVRPSTPRALAQPGSTLVLPGTNPATPVPGSPGVAVVSGGNNVAIDNTGPFAEFFGGQAASANERAMAQIFRIGGPPATNKSGAFATAAPVGGGPRIGLAGFRDGPSGMVVMVDVGALPPGNYIVGISDPSVISGAATTGTRAVHPKVQVPSQSAPPQPPTPAPGTGGRFVPSDAAPAPPGAGQPQGSLPPASNSLIARTVLAQVSTSEQSESVATDSGAVADTIPPTRQAGPSTNPPTGEVNPSSVNNAQQAQAALTFGTGRPK